jgi:predicted helicase
MGQSIAPKDWMPGPSPWRRARLQPAWEADRRPLHRGVVVLPIGAGKTVVALMAIEQLAPRTLIVVPTIDLLAL